MSVGENIAKLRKGAGLTQEELAEKLNISGQAVSKWENDMSCPDVEMLARISKLFGCTLDEVVNGKPAAPQMKSSDPKDVDRRVLTLIAEDGEHTKMNMRFPVGLIRRAFERGSLGDIVGDNASQIASVMGMINEGVTGELLKVEDGDTKLIIEVENYEG